MIYTFIHFRGEGAFKVLHPWPISRVALYVIYIYIYKYNFPPLRLHLLRYIQEPPPALRKQDCAQARLCAAELKEETSKLIRKDVRKDLRILQHGRYRMHI